MTLVLVDHQCLNNNKGMDLLACLLPLALCLYLRHLGLTGWENTIYLMAGYAILVAFVAMLGLHVGMAYVNSRSAIGVSLGTVFFLFVGVAACMRIMVAFAGVFLLFRRYAPLRQLHSVHRAAVFFTSILALVVLSLGCSAGPAFSL